MIDIELANMQLQSVRTVLQNDVNEITVCKDSTRESDVFYTVISITSQTVRRQVAWHISTIDLFATNDDFIGSYTQGERLNLVFNYRTENRLSKQESVLCTDTAKRIEIAKKLLVACAETQITGSVGMLLITPENINVNQDLSVYFNYFLDFKHWKQLKTESEDENEYFKHLSRRVFNILSAEYKEKDSINYYPNELQLFYKKMEVSGFNSFNSMIAFLSALPKKLQEPKTGFMIFWQKILSFFKFLQRNSINVFIIALLVFTAFFTIYQISMRISVKNTIEKNVTYVGLEQIGEVYLGDENL